MTGFTDSIQHGQPGQGAVRHQGKVPWVDVTPCACSPGERLGNFPQLCTMQRFEKPADGILLADGGISEAVGEGLTAYLKAFEALGVNAPML